MTHADVRIAIGAGLISVALTVGGPCVAAADPGRSGSSHSKHGGGSSRDRGPDRHGQDTRSGNYDRRVDRGDRGDDDAGRDQPTTSISKDTGSDYPIAARSAAAPTTSSRTPLVSAAAPQRVPPVPPVRPVEGAGGGGAPTAAPGDVASSTGPRVTFGNGRSPGILSDGPDEPRVVISNPVVAPAAEPVPPPPPPVNPSANALGWEPAASVFVDQIWAPLRPTFGSGLLFGIAGLVIMPLAGVWLGYRQARAAKAASYLVSTDVG